MEFDKLLKLSVEKKASDVFITAGRAPSIKVHGRIMPVSKEVLDADAARRIVFGIMSDKQRAEFDAHKECNFALSARGLGRFRVSAFTQRTAVGMVLRRIENHIPTLEELHLPPVLRDLAMTKRGLVLVTGATGTGKSTTLAAMVGHRNRNSTGHIVTIEDPVEFLHDHEGCIVTQREVGVDTESYAVALRNTLRQAPDVILIGEVRTRETMEQALAFAETGHLCLTTLHANNADQAMERILNFFPEDRHPQILMDLSLNLRGIVAQQLIRRKQGEGRRAAVEVLLNTPLAGDFIRRGEIHRLKDLMKASTELGMSTFDQALYNLYKQGEISYEDALAHADSANEVRLAIKLDTSSWGEIEEGLEGTELVEE